MADYIEKIVYINLKHRTDRKEQIEYELKSHFSLDKIQRFDAIRNEEYGAIGCTQSHIAVLEMAIKQNWKNILIVEDDMQWYNFNDGVKILDKLIKIPYDVIMLGGHSVRYDKKSYKLYKCITTTCYLVNNHYFRKLLENYQESLRLLIANRTPEYYLDSYFGKLQEKDKWYIIMPQMSIQRPSFSDIENRYVDNRRYGLPTSLTSYNNEIPNIIHFVYGFKEQTEEFELYKYIAIESAYHVNKPDKIYFYYWYEPYGQWWDKIKVRLTLLKTKIPTEIFGNPIKHYAHAADIIRLQKLNELGGIYLDIDTICLKPFTDLLNNEFVMGLQSNYGLCNATMLAKPNSRFGKLLIESYKTFRSVGRDKYWDEHSVKLPLKLSNSNPSLIKILDSTKLFYPLWHTMPQILFNKHINIHEHKNLIKNSYSIHLWDTFNHNYLKELTFNQILSENTIYNLFARKILQTNYTPILPVNNFQTKRVGFGVNAVFNPEPLTLNTSGVTNQTSIKNANRYAPARFRLK